MKTPVTTHEFLIRYVVFSKWIRQDQTVKQDAFIPPEHSLEISVTRRGNLTEDDIWRIGRKVAADRSRNLHGRADVKAFHIMAPRLSIVSNPVPENPNHANVVGWPLEKDVRKMIALEIAIGAHFIPVP